MTIRTEIYGPIRSSHPEPQLFAKTAQKEGCGVWGTPATDARPAESAWGERTPAATIRVVASLQGRDVVRRIRLIAQMIFINR
jgi:hypothetical protein